MLSCYGPNGSVSLLEQRQSLQHRAPANAPATRYWLRPVLDDIERQRILRGRGIAGEVCDASLTCSLSTA